MKRVLVYCEGPTEETFVKKILAPALYSYEVYLSPSSCGGVSKYSIIKQDLIRYCKSDPDAVITTMLDYYRLPSRTPGMDYTGGKDIYDRVAHVEAAILEDIGEQNLIPNVMLHEFEALLFSKPECFSYCGLSSRQMRELHGIRLRAESPEHIDNGINTAPSKRIISIYPEYTKVLDGYQIAEDIGLETMRHECKHFNEWIEKLIALS